jgi:iron complex transport system ATP-binding protein
MLQASNITVALGGRTIIAGIDFTARTGEVTAIVGPNGSGKTTLLRALTGDLPYSGSVVMNGLDVSRIKPREAAGMRAVLPQAAELAFPFTIHEVVRLGLAGGRTGALAGEVERLPERALARVGLAGFGGRFYQDLSGGEQQRVQLARVLCQVWAPVFEGTPRFLFLDEPVSSLDIRHQLAIMDIARDFAARGGGVVAILHDLNLTAMYADHVAVMHRGKLVEAGQPGEVVTDRLMSKVFDCPLRVGAIPAGGRPFVLPQSALAG